MPGVGGRLSGLGIERAISGIAPPMPLNFHFKKTKLLHYGILSLCLQHDFEVSLEYFFKFTMRHNFSYRKATLILRFVFDLLGMGVPMRYKVKLV